jgi:hypothetical protein
MNRQTISDKEPRAFVVNAGDTVLAVPEAQRADVLLAIRGLGKNVTFVSDQGRELLHEVIGGVARVRYEAQPTTSDREGALRHAVETAALMMGELSPETAYLGDDRSVAERFGMVHMDPTTVLGGITLAAEISA